MSTIDEILALPVGAEFTHRGRRFRRDSGCVSHYGPQSHGGERTTLYAWNDRNDRVLITLKENDK